MDMYNADGSQGEMCGNGIRCVAKYVYDKGLTDQQQILIEIISRDQISGSDGGGRKGSFLSVWIWESRS